MATRYVTHDEMHHEMHHVKMHSLRVHAPRKSIKYGHHVYDQDAILGMLLLVLATKAEQPAWWHEVARWTYQSCRAFLEHLTEPHASKVASNGQPQRMLKLGSCWVGWDCSNPSYHAPGHWRAFRCAADKTLRMHKMTCTTLPPLC